MRSRLRWVLPTVLGAFLPLAAQEAGAPLPGQIESMQQRIDDAFRSEDPAQIARLYDFTNCTPKERDDSLAIWTFLLATGTYQGATYHPFDAASDNTPGRMEPTVRLTGFFTLQFLNKEGDQKRGYPAPAGLTATGELLFAARRARDEPAVVPVKPTLPPAKPPQPGAISTRRTDRSNRLFEPEAQPLVKAVEEAVKNPTPEAIRALYHLDGIPEDAVEENLAVWQQLARDKDLLVHVAYQPAFGRGREGERLAHSGNGVTMTGNLEVLGDILLIFRSPGDRAPPVPQRLDVGIAPDGSPKLVMFLAEGKPIIPADPTPPGKVQAQPPTAEQIRHFVDAVRGAYMERNWRAVVQLNEIRGLTQRQLNEFAGRIEWQLARFKQRPECDVKFMELKDRIDAFFRSRGATALPIVGTITISLKAPGNTSTRTGAVGMNEEGELKLLQNLHAPF